MANHKFILSSKKSKTGALFFKTKVFYRGFLQIIVDNHFKLSLWILGDELRLTNFNIDGDPKYLER